MCERALYLHQHISRAGDSGRI